ncbi:MAG: PHP domain-containing protein [Clostridia bacterium]|nr:PHP domain-containing protein [Clostridia bacterium]
MFFRYDLHNHSCLSPCGDNDMTPYNLVNMAKLLDLDVIALTDHNTCLNCPAAVKVGEEIGITVIPGMELCTAEEVHVVCLFPDVENALAFSAYVRENMPPVKNRPDIFGEQRIMDERDNVIGTEELLLTTACSIGIYQVPGLVKKYGGCAFPAHIDRSSYSVISNLGGIDLSMGFNCAELTDKADVEEYLHKYPDLKKMKLIFDSDAHYLENMNMNPKHIQLDSLSAKAVVDFIASNA